MTACYIQIINADEYNSHYVDIRVKPVDNRYSTIYHYYGTVVIDGAVSKGLFTRTQFRRYGFIFV